MLAVASEVPVERGTADAEGLSDLGRALAAGTAWKPFLHHITKGQPQARRTAALKIPRKLPRVLTAAEMQAILDACDPQFLPQHHQQRQQVIQISPPPRPAASSGWPR